MLVFYPCDPSIISKITKQFWSLRTQFYIPTPICIPHYKCCFCFFQRFKESTWFNLDDFGTCHVQSEHGTVKAFTIVYWCLRASSGQTCRLFPWMEMLQPAHSNSQFHTPIARVSCSRTRAGDPNGAKWGRAAPALELVDEDDNPMSVPKYQLMFSLWRFRNHPHWSDMDGT